MAMGQPIGKSGRVPPRNIIHRQVAVTRLHAIGIAARASVLRDAPVHLAAHVGIVQTVGIGRSHGIQDIYVLGVFAEGCVRSTAVDAVKHGYTVHVIADAVASNAAWKKAFALWAMARAGAQILPSVVAPGGPSGRPAAGGR